MFVLLYFFFWPLCCLFFFDIYWFWLPLWYLQTPLTTFKNKMSWNLNFGLMLILSRPLKHTGNGDEINNDKFLWLNQFLHNPRLPILRPQVMMCTCLPGICHLTLTSFVMFYWLCYMSSKSVSPFHNSGSPCLVHTLIMEGACVYLCLCHLNFGSVSWCFEWVYFF